MADRFGSVDINISREHFEEMKKLNDAVVDVQSNVEKTGQFADKFLEVIKENGRIHGEMVFSLQQYGTLSQQISNNLSTFTSAQAKILDMQKSLVDYKKMQNVEETTSSSLLESQLEKQNRLQYYESQRIAKQITSPISSLEGGVMKGLPPQAQVAALIGGMLVKELGGAVSQMRDITRTGGGGVTDQGVAESAAIIASIKVSEMYIPFFKERYGSEAELSKGAATMYGYGGIRGGDLTKMMEEMPRLAHNAGMQFGEVANIMAAMNRNFYRTSDELIDQFDEVTRVGRDLGFNIDLWNKSIYDVTMKTAYLGVKQTDVYQVMANLAPLVQGHIINQEKANQLAIEGFKVGQTGQEIARRYSDLNKDATEAFVDYNDALAMRQSIEKTLADRVLGTTKAYEEAKDVTAKFVAAIQQGYISQESLNLATNTLGGHFGKTAKESVEYASGIANIAKSAGYSEKELLKFSLDLSETFLKITHDPKEAAIAGAAVSAAFVKELKDLNVSSGDLGKMFAFTTEKIRMGAGESMVLTKHFMDLSKATDVQTSSILGWYEQMTSGMMAFFKDPREASKIAQIAVDSTVSLLNAGKITVNDYTQIMKTQMDVMGQGEAAAIAQLNTLAKVVENTNVRMAELASQTQELSKLNRQYGFDQNVSNVLLVSFNEAMRTGSASMGDMNALLRGAGGAGEGIRAMIVSDMMKSGEFSGMNVGAAVDIALPNMMRAGGASAAKANATFRNIMSGMLEGFGGNETSQMWAFQKMSGSLLGQEVGAYGDDLKKIFTLAKTGDFSAVMSEVTRLTSQKKEDSPQIQLSKSLDKLSKGHDVFSSAVNTFDGAVQSFAGLIRTPIGSPGRKRDTRLKPPPEPVLRGAGVANG